MDESTVTVSYDNGIISGSCDPGWLYRDEAGDWRPIEELPGLQEWSDPGRPDIRAMTSDEIIELLSDRGYDATVEGVARPFRPRPRRHLA